MTSDKVAWTLIFRHSRPPAPDEDPMIQFIEYDPEACKTDNRAGLEVCPLLKALSPDAIRDVEQACNWYVVPPEQIIVKHHDPSDAAYFIISGIVRVFSRVQQQEINFAQFGPGDIFGELGAIDGQERSADVVTVTETHLAALQRPVFHDVLLRHPQLTFGLLVKFAGIIRRSDQQIMRFASLTAVQRVYLELLRLAAPDISGDGTWIISPAPLHKEIASWAGTTPDVVGRAIGHLMRASLLQLDRLLGEMEWLEGGTGLINCQ